MIVKISIIIYIMGNFIKINEKENYFICLFIYYIFKYEKI